MNSRHISKMIPLTPSPPILSDYRRDILQPATGALPTTVVDPLGRKAAEVKGKVQATKGAGLQKPRNASCLFRFSRWHQTISLYRMPIFLFLFSCFTIHTTHQSHICMCSAKSWTLYPEVKLITEAALRGSYLPREDYEAICLISI
jgi:hypothetical protein